MIRIMIYHVMVEYGGQAILFEFGDLAEVTAFVKLVLSGRVDATISISSTRVDTML